MAEPQEVLLPRVPIPKVGVPKLFPAHKMEATATPRLDMNAYIGGPLHTNLPTTKSLFDVEYKSQGMSQKSFQRGLPANSIWSRPDSKGLQPREAKAGRAPDEGAFNTFRITEQ